jgi:chromosome segregation ATPase
MDDTEEHDLSLFQDLIEGNGSFHDEVIDTENLKLQIKLLKDRNSDLLQSLKQSRDQVESVLQSSAKVKLMGEQLAQLQAQLQESEAANSRLRQSQTQLESANQLLAENEQLRSALAKSETTVAEQEGYIAQVIEANNQLKVGIESIKKSYQKSREKLKAARQQFQSNESEYQALATAHAALSQANEELKEEIRSFKNQSQPSAVQPALADSSALAFDYLSTQLEEQASQIASLQDQKLIVFGITQRLESILWQYETVACNLDSENAHLKSKIAVLLQESVKTPPLDIDNLDFQIEGDLKSQCLRLLSQIQFTPLQRIQLVLNALSTAIIDLTVTNAKLQRNLDSAHSALESERSATVKCKEIFNAFVTEVMPGRKLPFTELLQHSFTGQIALEGSVVPPAFFSLSAEDKIGVLHQFIGSDSPISMLFIAQFVVNDQLRQKASGTASLISAEFLESIKCQSITEVPRLFENLRATIKVLRTEKEKLEVKVAKLEKAFIERNRRTSEKISSIQRLRLQNHDLQNQVAVFELNVQTNEALAASIQSSPDKDLVISQLENQNRSLQMELEESQRMAQKAMKKLARTEEQLSENHRVFLAETESLKQRLNDQKKREKHRIHALTFQFQQELCASSAQLAESKQTFDANFERLKTRMEESREVSNERIHVLEENEQKCQRLVSENTRLQLVARTTNLKVAALEEQLAKERRLTQSHISAQRLAFESQLHQLSSALPNRPGISHGEDCIHA